MEAETREAGEGPSVQCSTSECYILNCKGFINIRIIIINPQPFPCKWVAEWIKGSSKKITSTFCRKGSNIMPLSRLSTKEGIVPVTISSAPMLRKPSGTSWLIVVWGLRLLLRDVCILQYLTLLTAWNFLSLCLLSPFFSFSFPPPI